MRKKTLKNFSAADVADFIKNFQPSEKSINEVIEQIHLEHIRTKFLKGLRSNSSVLDLGAGDGSLSIFRGWPQPARHDLKLYAYSLEMEEKFLDYDAYEIADWNVKKPFFGDMKFDAIMCSHFIEHIDDYAEVLQWISKRLSPGGLLYLEWPSMKSLLAPSLVDLAKANLFPQIGNFRDDATHKNLPDLNSVIHKLIEVGLSIHEVGPVSLENIEGDIFHHFADKNGSFELQTAYWSITEWAQYVICGLE